ncbi:hypothetical protein B0H13DRAFT_1066780 [Mycena leptocephala]|nr:hypothetical protein B0H13DRAFT_1066780 [Mycena leptocephala]
MHENGRCPGFSSTHARCYFHPPRHWIRAGISFSRTGAVGFVPADALLPDALDAHAPFPAEANVSVPPEDVEVHLLSLLRPQPVIRPSQRLGGRRARPGVGQTPLQISARACAAWGLAEVQQRKENACIRWIAVAEKVRRGAQRERMRVVGEAEVEMVGARCASLLRFPRRTRTSGSLAPYPCLESPSECRAPASVGVGGAGFWNRNVPCTSSFLPWVSRILIHPRSLETHRSSSLLSFLAPFFALASMSRGDASIFL